MISVKEWSKFLKQWSEEWLSLDEGDFPWSVRKNGWIGFKPATEKQIQLLERRLGYRLPPSYRAFLLTTNGWRQTTTLVGPIRPASRVQWLQADDPQLIETWCADAVAAPLAGQPPEQYFAYDQPLVFDLNHLGRTLKIADPTAGDSAIYLLNPEAVAENGEWEAWIHAHWIPGAERYPSFAHLMLAEYESFRVSVLGAMPREVPEGYRGVYAPELARHAAVRIGPGRKLPRRKTLAELIADLENESRAVRVAAAKQLFRQYTPHDPATERPEWVDTLSRILHSDREADVRSAAGCMLGSYGDHRALTPLVEALRDPVIADTAVHALFYLSIYMKDRCIADGLCEYLQTARDPSSTSTAMHILSDVRDVRLAPIVRRIITGDAHIQLRFQAAFALARTSPTAAEELLGWLAHENSEIRTVAAGALRDTQDRGALPPLRAALRDPDPDVASQARMSIQSLEHQSEVSRHEDADS